MEATNRVWDNSAKFNPNDFVRGKMNAMHADLGGNLGYDNPSDAFNTNQAGTRIRAGGIDGTTSAANEMGYGVRTGAARSSRASTFSGISDDEARSAESILHGSRPGFERRIAETRTTRSSVELAGIDAAGGVGALRQGTKNQTAWSIANQNTLGTNEKDAANRAKRLGITDYAGDKAAFDWADDHEISDQERGEAAGRIKAQEAFYGAVTVRDVAKELSLSDDELIKKSAEVNAARRGGDAMTMKKWQPEQIAAARAFENQHEILREDKKQEIAHNLGVSVETLQRMGYRMYHGGLTEDMATNINFQLWASGKKQQVEAGQTANIVFGPDYKLAFVDTSSGIQVSKSDTATIREGKTERKGDNVDLGDWYRNQDVLEATTEKGHVVIHRDPKTGTGMAATLRKGADLREGDSIHRGDTLRDEDLTEKTDWRGHVVEHRQRGKEEVVSSQTNRGLVEDVATPFGQMHRLKMVDGTPVWESLEGGRYRSDHVDSLAIDMGIYLTGSVSTATIRDVFGEDAAVGGAIFTKSAEEVLGRFDLGSKFISTPKTLLPAK